MASTESRPKPSSPKTTKITNTTATISWHDNSNNESGFDIYLDGKKIAHVGANKTTYTIKGLEQGTSYTYAIKAVKGSSSSAPVSKTFTTTGHRKEYPWLVPVIYNVLF